jgi:hypothetical protein
VRRDERTRWRHNKRRCNNQPWLCKHAPSSRTGGGPSEERAIAADAHRIARIPCDEFLFIVFLAEVLKKYMVCPVVKKKVPPNLELWVSIRTVLHSIVQLALAKKKFAYKFEFLRSRYGT